jgi:hypothetical protein
MTFPAGAFKEARLFGQYVVRKTVEFAAGTTGAVGNHDIFTVTGAAHVVLVAYCTEDLVGAGATISVGTDDDVDCLVAVTTAEDIDDGEIWFDNAPSECEANSSIGGAWVYDNLSYDVLVAPISDGTVVFVCFWTPVSDGATVVAT